MQIFTAINKDHREHGLLRRSVKGLLDPYIALRRNVAGVAHWALLLIALGWVAVWAILSYFHPQRQFWHDALAGTQLVATPNQTP